MCIEPSDLMWGTRSEPKTRTFRTTKDSEIELRLEKGWTPFPFHFRDLTSWAPCHNKGRLLMSKIRVKKVVVI